MHNPFLSRAEEFHLFFEEMLTSRVPKHHVLSISGKDGIGKSTFIAELVASIRTFSSQNSFFSAQVDETQLNCIFAIEALLRQFQSSGFELNKSEKIISTYYKGKFHNQYMYDSSCWSSPNSLSSSFRRAQGLRGVRYEGLNSIASLQEDFIFNLTEQFVNDLNELRHLWRVCLFFDSFNRMTTQTTSWLIKKLIPSILNTNIIVVVAIDDEANSSMTNEEYRLFQSTNYLLKLKPFSLEETCSYLIEQGIENPLTAKRIHKISQGIPLYIHMLSTFEPLKINTNADKDANVLQKVLTLSPAKQQIIFRATFLSTPFYLTDLKALMDEDADLFDWFTQQPFIEKRGFQESCYKYNDHFRELLNQYFCQEFQQESYNIRIMLVNYYQKQRSEVETKEGRTIDFSRKWLELTIAQAPQLFLFNDETSHIKAIELVLSVSRFQEYSGALVQMLKSLKRASVGDQKMELANDLIYHLIIFIEADLDSDRFLGAADYLLERIQQYSLFSIEQLALLYGQRGIAYGLRDEYQKALEDFNSVVALKPSYLWAYAQRGCTNRLLNKNSEALEDFNTVLALDVSLDWVYVQRGTTYEVSGELSKALTDFNAAIRQNPNYALAYVRRGEIYRTLGEYQQSLTDFNIAIALDSSFAWSYAQRAEVYRLLEKYPQAIEDFDHALVLAPELHWAYAQRGIVYRLMHVYESALTDFNCTIAAQPHLDWVYMQRGLTYKEIGDYQKALADFDHALTLDPSSTWAHAQRAEIYRFM